MDDNIPEMVVLFVSNLFVTDVDHPNAMKQLSKISLHRSLFGSVIVDKIWLESIEDDEAV